MKTDFFQFCGHWWVFQICWHIECSTFIASSFRTWNSSAWIPSPSLALFITMHSKAHLTLLSRMSGSRWVITPLCFSRSWRSFLYNSFVYSCHLFLISSASVMSNDFPGGSDGKASAYNVAQTVKRLLTMRETWVQSLGQEDLLEKEMATHSSILAWKIPWTVEPGRLQSMGPQRVGHDWVASLSLSLQCGRPGFDPWVGKILWRQKWQPTPVLLPGKSHGQRSLVGYSTWGRKESDTTERLNFLNFLAVRSIPFLSFIVPLFAWNTPLVSLIFLKRSLVFPILLFSSISLHWSLR